MQTKPLVRCPGGHLVIEVEYVGRTHPHKVTWSRDLRPRGQEKTEVEEKILKVVSSCSVF